MQRGGLSGLLAAVLRRYVFDYRRFYLYERDHGDVPEEDIRPRLQQFEEHFIVDNESADALAREHEDFRVAIPMARRALESGAVAFCIYAGNELAHVSWLAMSEPARRSLDHLGFVVRFEQGEAWSGMAWTAPQYRGQGLLTYSGYRRFEYLLRSGGTSWRSAVETNNTATQRMIARYDSRIYAVGRQWRLFGRLRWWSEREVPCRDASCEAAGPGADAKASS